VPLEHRVDRARDLAQVVLPVAEGSGTRISPTTSSTMSS
jgi:hypothetical protein